MPDHIMAPTDMVSTAYSPRVRCSVPDSLDGGVSWVVTFATTYEGGRRSAKWGHVLLRRSHVLWLPGGIPTRLDVDEGQDECPDGEERDQEQDGEA